MLTEERRASLLTYCKLEEFVDDPAEMELVGVLYDAAVGYLAGAGVGELEGDSEKRAMYDLCVNCLVNDAHDKRSAELVGVSSIENPVFRTIFNQLKVSNLGTGWGL